jgi:hypothetical protein
MIKLKTILTEGFAWERKEGKSLPTMAEVKAEYDAKQLKETDSNFSEYSNDALTDMKINLSRYQGNESEIASINNELASRKQKSMGGSYESMSPGQLIAAAEKAGMEEMIIMGYDGELENEQEIIDLLNAEDSDMREAAKPDFLDLDGDGNEKESMKSAANEAVGQEEADTRWNDPIQMGMRDISKPTTTNSIKAPSNFYREKLVSLKAQRKQIEFDMEQEAEPEGGPVADYYGDALQHVDGQIDMIMQKIRTNESMNEGFVSRLKKNLIGAELRK